MGRIRCLQEHSCCVSWCIYILLELLWQDRQQANDLSSTSEDMPEIGSVEAGSEEDTILEAKLKNHIILNKRCSSRSQSHQWNALVPATSKTSEVRINICWIFVDQLVNTFLVFEFSGLNLHANDTLCSCVDYGVVSKRSGQSTAHIGKSWSPWLCMILILWYLHLFVAVAEESEEVSSAVHGIIQRTARLLHFGLLVLTVGVITSSWTQRAVCNLVENHDPTDSHSEPHPLQFGPVIT